MSLDLVVRARRAVVGGAMLPCSVGVRSGTIETVTGYSARLDAAETVTLHEDEVLLPGLVDTHVHVNEPGRTEWEGFASATRAAAAGGVTTIIDMPLNSVPPTTTAANLRAKQDVARDQIAVDVGFWGGAVPGNLADLAELHAAGVFGFKCFLIDSGVPEFSHLDADEFAAAMDEVTRLGALMLVHAEDPGLIDERRAAGRAYAGFLASRPSRSEESAVGSVAEQALRTRARTHVLHLSSADSLPLVRAARAAGADLSVETCPHYLVFEAEGVPDGATEFKCCPPIRDAGNRDKLWASLAAGDIDLVVSDHSPSTPELKRAAAPAGTSGWRGAVSRRSRSRSRPCGPPPGNAATTSPTWSGGWPPVRPTVSASATRGGSRPVPTRTWWCWPRTRRSWSTSPPSHTRTWSPRTPAAGSRAPYAAPGCVGRSSHRAAPCTADSWREDDDDHLLRPRGWPPTPDPAHH
jgi:allantoinase